MRRFHAICGLPRSGSTLLQNILAQNPRFEVSSTSPLAYFLEAIGNAASTTAEFKSELAADRSLTEARLRDAMRGLIEGWYGSDCIVFDKSRLWSRHALTLQLLYPDSVLIVCVRDPREIIASFERQHRKAPMLSMESLDGPRSLFGRTAAAMAPNGMLGACLEGVTDLIRRRVKETIFVRWEDLATNPGAALSVIYEAIDEPDFVHDFDNVMNVSTDLDAMYLYKYPHEGSGSVEYREPTWPEILPVDVAQYVYSQSEAFCRLAGYEPVKKVDGARKAS